MLVGGLILGAALALAGEVEVGASGYGTVLPDDHFTATPNPNFDVRLGYLAAVTDTVWLRVDTWVSPISSGSNFLQYGREWAGVEGTATLRFPVGDGWVGPVLSVGDTTLVFVRILPGFAGELGLPAAIRLAWATRPVGLVAFYGELEQDIDSGEEPGIAETGLQLLPTLGPTTVIVNRPFGFVDLGLRYMSPPFPFGTNVAGIACIGPDLRIHAGRVTLVGFGGLGRGIFVTPLRWYADLSLQILLSAPTSAPSTAP